MIATVRDWGVGVDDPDGTALSELINQLPPEPEWEIACRLIDWIAAPSEAQARWLCRDVGEIDRAKAEMAAAVKEVLRTLGRASQS